MKKRLLTVLLAVCLVVALGTVTAMADDDPVATVNGTKHYTLNDVLTAAQEAGTADIVLLADIKGTTDGNISIPESNAKGMPVTIYRPNSISSQAYINFAKELIDYEEG